MAPKKRRKNSDDDDSQIDPVEPEVEVEVEPEVEEEEPSDGDSGEPATTYVMGKIYVAGVEDEEEESDAPVNVDEYEEIDDSSDLKKARDLIAGANTDDDAVGGIKEDKDVFLENANYDSSEDWSLGD